MNNFIMNFRQTISGKPGRFDCRTVFVLLVFLSVVSCGGGGNSTPTVPDTPTTPPPPPPPPPPAELGTGQFKGSTNVEGLNYRSGEQSGVTNALGEFTYEIDGDTAQQVTFSVGKVTLGGVTGKSIITPLDLHTEWERITRFLILLDQDETVSNGIRISSGINERAENWPPIDFAADDFEEQVESNILADVISVYANTALELVSQSDAQDNLKETLGCVYSGGFKGTYSSDKDDGGDSGTFGLLVQPDGGMTGVSYSTVEEASDNSFSGTVVDFTGQEVQFSGDTALGSTFNGKYTSVDRVEGTWMYTNPTPSDGEPNDAGIFSGERIGGATDVVWRFTGRYEDDTGADAGLFTFDIDNENRLRGISYSAIEDELYEDMGTASVDSGMLMGSGENNLSFSATFDSSTGLLTGGTYNDDGSAGTFSGSGCQLNHPSNFEDDPTPPPPEMTPDQPSAIQELPALETLTITDQGGINFFSFSAGAGCIVISSNTRINGVTYTTHSSEWQKRTGAGSPWVDIQGSKENNRICGYDLTASGPGEYRIVVDMTIDGTRAMYSSSNTIIKN